MLVGLIIWCLCKMQNPIEKWKKLNKVNPLRRTSRQENANSKILGFLRKFRTKRLGNADQIPTITQTDTQAEDLNSCHQYEINFDSGLDNQSKFESRDSTNDAHNKLRISDDASALSNRLNTRPRDSFAFALFTS